MANTPLLHSLNRNGFVKIPRVVTGPQLDRLREAAQSAAKLGRDGKWRDVRTLPKQFPPWNVGENPAQEGIWGIQGVMHPNMPLHDEFIRLYFSEDLILKPTKQLLQCSGEDLVMELFNLLIRPDRDFELRWHRDDIPATADPEQEMERLGKPAFHAQWNLALYEDTSLVVIPGSHKRARTETERNADPYEAVLPNQLVVRMEPGDIVFYNNNILHRGVYDSSKERMTLHGSCGHVDGAKARARNVLQHGVREWISQMDFGKALEGVEKTQAELMRQNLLAMGREAGEVGYSLDG
ncbi:uncharacterized protein E0L32_006298 [Thyridium curvatum]|uniref:Phytanoyl-CoA dioxygenase n=1 Tax=Thyridium curvatum TaxID=1093900 RepID=A0A507AR63_9PEZI|nr:uncharacterized protein E0L32_006298 [Thyridium curvatum]TPX13325.1 hypothetical protein E0L32_006298 [Thyridium curvatum]